MRKRRKRRSKVSRSKKGIAEDFELGAIPKQFVNRLKEIGVTAEIGQVQKAVLLGTARTLRNALEIYGGWL